MWSWCERVDGERNHECRNTHYFVRQGLYVIIIIMMNSIKNSIYYTIYNNRNLSAPPRAENARFRPRFLQPSRHVCSADAVPPSTNRGCSTPLGIRCCCGVLQRSAYFAGEKLAHRAFLQVAIPRPGDVRLTCATPECDLSRLCLLACCTAGAACPVERAGHGRGNPVRARSTAWMLPRTAWPFWWSVAPSRLAAGSKSGGWCIAGRRNQHIASQ